MQKDFTGRGHGSKAPRFDDQKYPAPPALEAYLSRLTAALGEPPQRRNLRRWVWVQEGRDHYHYDAVVVTLDLKTYEVRCKSDDETHAPTPEEIEAIKAEKYTDWPTSITATDGLVQNLRKMLRQIRDKEPTLFVAYAPNGKDVLFVQERIYDVDGLKKKDLPWTHWSDNQWRMLEPDGDLPLFGLDHLATAARVFLHEGAKKALHCQKLIESGEWKKHPWGEDLRLGSCHIGWPGGAPNPHRVDWSPIRQLSPHVQVIIVCDNDESGENVAPKISCLLLRPLRMIRFDETFPPHFDLADDFPPEKWKPNSQGVLIYKGQRFDECLYPATWATTVKGKRQVVLRAPFAAEWYHTVKPETFVHRGLPKHWTPPQFNSLVAPFSHSKDVANLLRQQLHGKAEKLAYDPSRKAGIINTDDGSILNVFRPSPIKGKKGDAKPWEEFMEHLIPDPTDREHTYRWCATLVVHPEVRMRYGMLLISERQGVGKSTLFVILMRLVGLWNVSLPEEEKICNSQFNEWKAMKRLAVVHEIYSGQTKKAYNRLKSTITDDTVDVNEKFIAPYTLQNWVHIVASSNALYALYLDDDDRRWLAPRVTEEIQTEAYWAKFYAWLNDEDGLAIIRWWMEQFLKTHPAVATGAHAPMTGAKREIIAENRTPGSRLAFDLAQMVAQMAPQKMLLSMTDVREWVANKT